MAERCVKIEAYDDGRVLVGLVPQDIEQNGPVTDEEEAEKQYMQPVDSIDEALDKARELLGAPGAPTEGGEEAEMQQGFATRQPMGPHRMMGG